MNFTSSTTSIPLGRIRAFIGWAIAASIVVPFVFFGARVLPDWQRRSDLHSRVERGCVLRTFSPFMYRANYFATRPVFPSWLNDVVGERWTRPLEPITRAVFAPDSDDEVRLLSAEVELQDVTIIAEEGVCSDKLLVHLAQLPRLRTLALCNVPLTDQGIALLSRMPIKELFVECSAEPSPGFKKLNLLTQIEELRFMDRRCPLTDEICLPIGDLPNLKACCVGTSWLSPARLDVLTRSASIESIGFNDSLHALTLDGARRLAAMKSIKLIDISAIDSDAAEFLKSKGLLVEEVVLLSLPPT